MMTERSVSRRGFTLVELLVVIAIIGVLVGLLLPAVQAAREAARRMQCQNNLKQIGLSIHNYESAYKVMPPGAASYIDDSGFAGTKDDDGYGFLCFLLPFIEQQALYEQVDPSGLWEENDGISGRPIQHMADRIQDGTATIRIQTRWAAATTPVQSYLCPSSAMPNNVPDRWLIPGAREFGVRMLPINNPKWIGLATSSYKGCGGSHMGNNSVLVKRREGVPREFKRITDGLSNTIAVGESTYVSPHRASKPPQPTDDFRAVTDWPVWIGMNRTDEAMRFTARSASPINAFASPSKMFRAIDDDCAFSYHAGGAQFLFCDGSVRFLTESISMDTYGRLAGMDDGEVIGEF